MDKYAIIEDFVSVHDAVEVMKHYQIASDTADWEMAIKTHIALGNRSDLEDIFPGWAGCNPDNHDWN